MSTAFSAKACLPFGIFSMRRKRMNAMMIHEFLMVSVIGRLVLPNR